MIPCHNGKDESRIEPRSFLSNAYKTDRLSHAYLLTGGNNLAIQDLIYWIGGLLFCSEQLVAAPNNIFKPCGSCRPCTLIQKEGHTDLNIIRPIDGSIKIAQIRQLKSSAYFRPLMSKWKLTVILDAHTMTEEAAQSILKILEEPPQYMVLVLTSPHNNALLPTIVSRCQSLHLYGDEACKESDDTSLIEQVLSAVYMLHVNTASTQNTDIIVEVSRHLETDKGDRHKLLSIFAGWYWDCARLLSGVTPHGIEHSLNEKWLDTIKKYGGKLTFDQVFAIYDTISNAIYSNKKNANWRLLLDLLLFKIRDVVSEKEVVA